MNGQNECGFYPVTSIIEVVVNDKKDFDFQDGYPVEKLEKILAFKQGRNKPKDKLDIENITKYLEQRNKVKQL